MDSLIGTQITVAMIAAYVIEFLKKQPWFPFANVDDSKLNRVFSAFVALITSAGLTMVFDREAGTLVVTGLTMGTLGHAIWLAVQQYAFAHATYKAVVQKPVQADTVVVTPPDDQKIEGKLTLEEKSPNSQDR